jgi:hypothetical protein
MAIHKFDQDDIIIDEATITLIRPDLILYNVK